jgi:hypothetical protein
MTQNKTVGTGNGRQQEEREQLAKNKKRRTVGRKKETRDFLPFEPYKT